MLPMWQEQLWGYAMNRLRISSSIHAEPKRGVGWVWDIHGAWLGHGDFLATKPIWSVKSSSHFQQNLIIAKPRVPASIKLTQIISPEFSTKSSWRLRLLWKHQNFKFEALCSMDFEMPTFTVQHRMQRYRDVCFTGIFSPTIGARAIRGKRRC